MRIKTFLLLAGLLLTPATFSFGQCESLYDFVITNARIVDGTGNPWFRGSVAVKNGRIARVGRFEHPCGNVIDAKGQIVAPGFIDVHAHTENIYDQPMAENFIRMGVTT